MEIEFSHLCLKNGEDIRVLKWMNVSLCVYCLYVCIAHAKCERSSTMNMTYTRTRDACVTTRSAKSCIRVAIGTRHMELWWYVIIHTYIYWNHFVSNFDVIDVFNQCVNCQANWAMNMRRVMAIRWEALGRTLGKTKVVDSVKWETLNAIPMRWYNAISARLQWNSRQKRVWLGSSAPHAHDICIYLCNEVDVTFHSTTCWESPNIAETNKLFKFQFSKGTKHNGSTKWNKSKMFLHTFCCAEMIKDPNKQTNKKWIASKTFFSTPTADMSSMHIVSFTSCQFICCLSCHLSPPIDVMLCIRILHICLCVAENPMHTKYIVFCLSNKYIRDVEHVCALNWFYSAQTKCRWKWRGIIVGIISFQIGSCVRFENENKFGPQQFIYSAAGAQFPTRRIHSFASKQNTIYPHVTVFPLLNLLHHFCAG